MPEGKILHISRTTGWCDACANIEPVEEFPDKQQTETELDNLHKARKRADRFRWLKSFRDKAEILDEEIKEKELILRFLELRTTPPRCLSCGCNRITLIKVPSVDENEVARLDFVHPGCGGAFTVSNSGMRLAISFPRRIYNHNGHVIE